ncbi:DNA helicase PcrA [Lachnospiraceae bacterium HCP1S3_C3]
MSIYDTLNDMQKEAVFHTEGPLLILAGAGSGKTRVLTHRIAYLIEEKGVNPWNIMAITFTNKAAGEMKERVESLVGFGSEQIWVSTFHSTCVRILRRYIDRLGYSNNFTIYDTDDQKSVMRDVCKRLNIDTKLYKERNILSQISKAKDEFMSPEQYSLANQGDFSKKRMTDAYKSYQEQLKSNNALDFDDLLFKTVELFTNNPDILEQYRNRFKYIMVDEYQDTNTVQFKFISLLAGEHRNLCVVGDDDQSIYKFRGANIKNILNFEKVFSDARVIKLEQNYRSTQTILNAANEVIKNNTERKDKKLWTDHGDGEKISFKMLDNAQEEAILVADEIDKYVKDNHAYKDCACLYRTNAQSRLLEEAFMRKNIPYKIVGGVNFYQRKEIKDVLAYLKTVDNGMDDLAVKRIINIPKRGIGATTIEKIQTFADYNGCSFYDAIKDEYCIANIGRSAEKVRNFGGYIQTLRTKKNYISVSELIEEILEDTGYIAELKAENTDEALDRISNIEELVSKSADYEQKAEEPNLSGFLEEVALVADIDSLDENSDYVVLMTIHSAKGLEFPNVFLCGMEDGLFPGYMTIMSDDPSDMEEERRLCYVAITRAMEKLHISAAKQRMIHGETQYNRVSRFVKEIPKELLDTGRITENPMRQRIVKPTQTSSAKPIFKAKAFEANKFKVSKATNLEYTNGDRVKHIKFGEGTVVKIADGGRDYEVTVNFDKVGVKKMFASFAKLKKI